MDRLAAVGTASTAAGEKATSKTADKSKHRMFGSGSMSRLRNTSLSLKAKPKLFGKHERTESGKEANEVAVTDAGAEEVSTKDQTDASEAPKIGRAHV